MFREHARKRLAKKAKKGFRGFPVATVAFYGPDDRRASKLAVGIVLAENEEAVELKRWFAEQGDVRELPHVREHRLYLLARALAEPPSEREQPRVLQLLPSAKVGRLIRKASGKMMRMRPWRTEALPRRRWLNSSSGPRSQMRRLCAGISTDTAP